MHYSKMNGSGGSASGSSSTLGAPDAVALSVVTGVTYFTASSGFKSFNITIPNGSSPNFLLEEYVTKLYL